MKKILFFALALFSLAGHSQGARQLLAKVSVYSVANSTLLEEFGTGNPAPAVYKEAIEELRVDGNAQLLANDLVLTRSGQDFGVSNRSTVRFEEQEYQMGVRMTGKFILGNDGITVDLQNFDYQYTGIVSTRTRTGTEIRHVEDFAIGRGQYVSWDQAQMLLAQVSSRKPGYSIVAFYSVCVVDAEGKPVKGESCK